MNLPLIELLQVLEETEGEEEHSVLPTWLSSFRCQTKPVLEFRSNDKHTHTLNSAYQTGDCEYVMSTQFCCPIPGKGDGQKN